MKFADICCGIGGFHMAALKSHPQAKCVYSADIKKSAIKVYKDNFDIDCNHDITTLDPEGIPDFDILFAGFPCQSFSSAGKRKGFEDTRGTIFFHILNIVNIKKPPYLVLENVEGLLNHQNGKTFQTIQDALKDQGYHVSYKIISGIQAGIPQDRKRLFIVCSKKKKFIFPSFDKKECKLKDILERDIKINIVNDNVSQQILKTTNFVGKKITDKRGGGNNIHSWNLSLKGKINSSQTRLMDKFLTERRKKKWAKINDVEWKDGMPLSIENITCFHEVEGLQDNLEDLVHKKYLKKVDQNYDMYGGKLSFSISHILHPEKPTPTIVATDANKLAVYDNGILRRLTVTELLRLFGYPEDFKMNISYNQSLNLLGNSVIVPIVEKIIRHLL